jgi:hypothetical protein
VDGAGALLGPEAAEAERHWRSGGAGGVRFAGARRVLEWGVIGEEVRFWGQQVIHPAR